MTLRLHRPACLSWPRERWLELYVRAAAVGCVLLVTACGLGLLALHIVGGTWRNWVELQRIVSE